MFAEIPSPYTLASTEARDVRIPAFYTPLPHSTMADLKTIGGKPDLNKLAKKGRVKLKSNGDVEGQATNKVLHVDKKPILVQEVVVGYKDLPTYGGHATLGDSVWRVALGGPTKYHQKVLKDKRRKESMGAFNFRPAVPELDFDSPEYNEYQEYVVFLAEKGVEISTDEAFYTWKKEPKEEKKSPGRPKKVEEVA